MKRITTHPNRKRRQEVAKEHVSLAPQAQLDHLDACGYVATKERRKLAKKVGVASVKSVSV